MIFDRVVAEEREVAGTAARRDAGRHGDHAALRGVLSNGVEVGRGGRFERRGGIRPTGGKIAEAIEHQQHEFGVGFECQF